MKKFIVGAVATAMFALPFAASAATISNPLFSNGDTTIDAQGGSTVNGTFTLTVGSGEVVEYLRTQADTQPFTDTSVGSTLGYQEGVYLNVPFSAKVSPNTGTYNIAVQGAGTFGGSRSINGGDNVVLGSTNVGTVRVVAGSTSSTTTGSSNDFSQLLAQIQSLSAIVAQLQAQLALGSHTPDKPSCPPSGSTNMVQAWLMANGYAAGFNAAGVYAPTGFWGQITTAAYAQANAACK